jgi:hypothetical protein
MCSWIRGERRALVFFVYRISLLSELAQNCLHIDRIPEHDHIDDKPERAELIFLPFAVALTKLTSFTAENDARNAVPTFSPFELCQRSPGACLCRRCSGANAEFCRCVRIQRWPAPIESGCRPPAGYA